MPGHRCVCTWVVSLGAILVSRTRTVSFSKRLRCDSGAAVSASSESGHVHGSVFTAAEPTHRLPPRQDRSRQGALLILAHARTLARAAGLDCLASTCELAADGIVVREPRREVEPCRELGPVRRTRR